MPHPKPCRPTQKCGQTRLHLLAQIASNNRKEFIASPVRPIGQLALLSLFLFCSAADNPAPLNLSQASFHVKSIIQIFTHPLVQQQQQDWFRQRATAACVLCPRQANNSRMSAGDAAPLGYAQRRAMQNSSPLRGSPSKRERGGGACSGSCNTHCPSGTAVDTNNSNMEAQVCCCCPSNNYNLAQQHQHQHSAAHASLVLPTNRQVLPCRHALGTTAAVAHTQVVQLAQLVHAMQQQAAASESASTEALASMVKQLRSVTSQQEQQQQQQALRLEGLSNRCVDDP